MARAPARLIAAAALAASLAACNTPNLNEPAPPVQPRLGLPEVQGTLPRVVPTADALGRPARFGAPRVAILVPLTGEGSGAGTALLQAAQMAVLDNAPDNFQLLPFDTRGTPEGATEAADAAMAAGAELILGPLFSRSVPQVAALAAAYDVNVITFSNDARVAGNNVYVIGLLPSGQVDRILSYAVGRGLDDIAVVAPANEYGLAVLNAAEIAAARYGIRLVHKHQVPAGATFDPVIGAISSGLPPDAALIAEGGLRLREAAGFFGFYEMPDVQLLGTELWNDPNLWTEPALLGGWFPATDPAARESFAAQYELAFGQRPPALAVLGYDAASLAGLLARDGGPQRFGDLAIQSPSGFAGFGGLFRFSADGLAERGLAVMEVRRGEAVTVDQPPATLAGAGF